MVQKYQSPVRVYKYPFELVMAAYQKRFPTCKMIPVFVGSEILVEHKSEDGAIHIVERRCKLNVDAPYLLKKIVGVDYVYFIQKNSLDMRSRTLKINAYNESFSTRIIIRENCQYFVHPENPNWTCFEQDASLDIKAFFGFESTVEKLAMKQYEQNIKKGKEVIQYYIAELISEGKENAFPPLEPIEEVDETNADDDDNVIRGESIIVVEEGEECVFSDAVENIRVETESCVSKDGEEGTSGVASTSRRRTMSTGSQVVRKIKTTDKGGEDVLNAEYIERYLGENLSPVQESALIQLRKWLQDSHKGKMPHDAHLLRFLSARDFNVEKTRDMLHQSLLWRKQYQIDKLLTSYTPPQVLVDYTPGGWYGYDRGNVLLEVIVQACVNLTAVIVILDGQPMYVLRLGQMDVKGLVKSCGEEAVVKYVIFIAEQGLQKTWENTQTKGHPVLSWTLLVDLEGLSMRHLWRPGVRTLLRIIELLEANYPETMGRLLIVRAPRVFPVLWTLVSPFIDENTRKKFMIYGGSDYLGEGGVADFIDKAFIPDFLCGPAKCNFPVGEFVPKSLYMLDFDDPCSDDPPLCADTIYQFAHVTKGNPHEVLIQVMEKGCVVTWDFDVVKGDCVFTVLRTKRPLQGDQYSSGSTSPVSSVASSIGGRPSALVCGSIQLGARVEVYNVEPPVVCGEGDSIQGTHITQTPGSYLLQWKYYERGSTPHVTTTSHIHHHSTLPSIMGPKCKVMYYYELLNSEDFKGSMASLQSCRRSFSSLSVCSEKSSSGSTNTNPGLHHHIITPGLLRAKSSTPSSSSSHHATHFTTYHRTS